MDSDNDMSWKQVVGEMSSRFWTYVNDASPLEKDYVKKWIVENLPDSLDTVRKNDGFGKIKEGMGGAKKSIRDSGWGPDKVLQERLLAPLKQKMPKYRWNSEHYFAVPVSNERVDLRGWPESGPEIWIELERERATCVRNVVKVWKYLERAGTGGSPISVLLIHIFSPFFGPGEEMRKWFDETEFLGSKAQEHNLARNLEYVPHVWREWPLIAPNGVDTLADQIQSMAANHGL